MMKVNLNKPGIACKQKIYRQLLFLFICILTTNSYAQTSDLEVGLFNIGTGAFIGGIGSVINKRSDQKAGKVFLRGLARGAFGGYLVFESKRLLRHLDDDQSLGMVYPSKFINSVGNSIIENAARNGQFLTRWHINFGFNRFELETKDKWSFNYRVNLFAFYGTILNFKDGRKLEIRKSLQLGTVIFKGDIEKVYSRTGANIITFSEEFPLSKKTIAHELIHVYQYEQLSGVTFFLNPSKARLLKSSKFFQLYNQWFFTDLNYLLEKGVYHLNPNYDTNIIEIEARHFN